MLRLFQVAAEDGSPTLKELGARLGMHYSMLSRLARGERNPTLRLRNAVKAAFPQYDPDWLLGEADPDPEPAERSA